jgi:predicted dehydrogenase
MPLDRVRGTDILPPAGSLEPLEKAVPMINAAIVGLGWWGKTLVNAVQGKSHFIRFVAAHTRTRAKVEDFCREKQLAFQESLDTILGDPKIDAVVYAAQHSDRSEQVQKTAAAGKHVFVEKPFALNLNAADSALAAVKRAGVVLAVGYQRRFPPSVVELRARVKDGRLGTLVAATGEATAPAGAGLAKDFWRTDPTQAPAGAMTGLGVHVLDTFVDFFGAVDEVYCINVRRAAPHIDDSTSVQMVMKNGVPASFYCSLSTAASYRIAVFGTSGYGEVLRPNFDTFQFIPAATGPLTGQFKPAEPEVIVTKDFDAVKAELEAFAQAIQDKRPYPISHDEIRHVTAAFEAIVKSAATKQPVKVAST